MYNKIVRVKPVKINSKELASQLAKAQLTPYWKVSPNGSSLIRTCEFPNFETTWGFLTQVSMRAHLWGHHPSIATTYNRVSLELTTHDLRDDSSEIASSGTSTMGGISDIDIKLAKKIEEYIHIYSSEEKNSGTT